MPGVSTPARFLVRPKRRTFTLLLLRSSSRNGILSICVTVVYTQPFFLVLDRLYPSPFSLFTRDKGASQGTCAHCYWFSRLGCIYSRRRLGCGDWLDGHTRFETHTRLRLLLYLLVTGFCNTVNTPALARNFKRVCFPASRVRQDNALWQTLHTPTRIPPPLWFALLSRSPP